MEQSLRERYRFVLVFLPSSQLDAVSRVGKTYRSITCHEAYLCEGIFKTVALRSLRISRIGVQVPASPLLDFGYNESPRDVWYPVSVSNVSAQSISSS